MANNHIVAPSVLSADFLHLADEIEMVNQSKADWFHLDIMDGKFVPNITFGFDIIKQINTLAKKPLDVHLMIVEPERYIERFAKAGADIITVHYEASVHLHRTLMQIKEAGAKAGIALNPHTPVSVLEEILPYADMVLIMSVNPGFGGQKFIETSVEKVSKLNKMKEMFNPGLIIEVDGGVNLETGARLVKAGATALVAGSFVFKSNSPIETIKELKAL